MPVNAGMEKRSEDEDGAFLCLVLFMPSLLKAAFLDIFLSFVSHISSRNGLDTASTIQSLGRGGCSPGKRRNFERRCSQGPVICSLYTTQNWQWNPHTIPSSRPRTVDPQSWTLNPNATPDSPNRIWYPGELVAEYYTQRTTPGGLLVNEGIPPSLQCSGMPGVPGLFCKKQKYGWKKVVDAVHARGGYIYAQCWNAGRAAIPQHTGTPTISASATPYGSDECYAYPPPGTSTKVRYKDFPPEELSVDGIKKQVADYTTAAKMAVEECGFDGVEVHGGNGYLPEQFLSSNINTRTDDYGGSPEKRCKFVLELMDALAEAIGENKLAIRLTPFGLHNEAREFLSSWGLGDIDLKFFRNIFGETPFISAGGWNNKNVWGVVEEGTYDAIAIGRFFLSTPDIVFRLKEGLALSQYDRSRFYGPFPEREIGYTDYDFWSA